MKTILLNQMKGLHSSPSMHLEISTDLAEKKVEIRQLAEKSHPCEIEPIECSYLVCICKLKDVVLQHWHEDGVVEVDDCATHLVRVHHHVLVYLAKYISHIEDSLHGKGNLYLKS